MTTRLFDAAIIGGGIAGCAAAIRLAQQGQKVILCEAKGYPHHKVCGEFLSPECSSLLDELGLTSSIQAVKPAMIHKVAIIAPNGSGWESSLPGEALGISRYRLDELMAAQARACGVDFRDHTVVTSVQGSLDTNFELNLRTPTQQYVVRARSVIGAHGKRSGVDRALNRRFLKKSQPFVALKAHFYGTPIPGRIHLYAFPGGYCGVSEVENGQMNVCLLVRQEIFQQATNSSSSSIASFIDWMKTQNPALGEWFATARPVYEDWLSIAQVPFSLKEAIVNDVLMVGDSAGLIAPIAGDGMGMALQASKMVSRLLGDYLTGRISAEALRRQYTADWKRTFGMRLRLSNLMQGFMLRPNWLSPGLKLLNTAPALGDFLMNHTRDIRPVQSKGAF